MKIKAHNINKTGSHRLELHKDRFGYTIHVYKDYLLEGAYAERNFSEAKTYQKHAEVFRTIYKISC